MRKPSAKQGENASGKTLRAAGGNLFGAVWIWLSLWGLEWYLRAFLSCPQRYGLWISAGWAAAAAATVLLFPRTAARILYGIGYFPLALFAAGQVGCHKILGHMIWLSDISHLGEGAEYGGTILGGLSAAYWLALAALIAAGVVGVVFLPSFRRRWYWRGALLAIAAVGLLFARSTLSRCLYYDASSDREKSDATVFRLTTTNYGIYTTLYDAEQTYTVCGYYQLLEQDVKQHHIKPLLPSYQQELADKKETADAFFSSRTGGGDNEMTGLLAGKNVVMVLMETMDDFLFNEEDTPTLCRLMGEGINFTNFYTPVYSSIHTFNTEFCANTGFFLPTSGKSALYYSKNDFSESLPFLFRALGYRANAFHYNTPVFYNRGVMLPAIGYEAYNCYADDTDDEQDLYDECYLFKNDALRELALNRSSPFFDYIITRNAHTPYTYDDPFAQYALNLHPEYKGKYGNETLDVIECKARAVDDLFAELLKQLQAYGQLENTVIVAFTDHYAYPISDQAMVQKLSGVDNTYLEMKTPCFIWSAGMKPVTVDKTLNTADFVPTLVNLFGLDSDRNYLGRDAFDESYPGYVVFSDGSWLSGGVLCSGGQVTEELWDGAAEDVDIEAMNRLAANFIQTSDALMETDYYRGK